MEGPVVPNLRRGSGSSEKVRPTQRRRSRVVHWYIPKVIESLISVACSIRHVGLEVSIILSGSKFFTFEKSKVLFLDQTSHYCRKHDRAMAMAKMPHVKHAMMIIIMMMMMMLM